MVNGNLRHNLEITLENYTRKPSIIVEIETYMIYMNFILYKLLLSEPDLSDEYWRQGK